MNRHPPSSYGDEPPAYPDEASSFLSEPESPTAASRNGATMRLLPTTGNDGDLSGSPQAPSYQPGFDDSTPYVHPPTNATLFSGTFPSLSLQRKPHAPLVSFGYRCRFGRRARNEHARITIGRDWARSWPSIDAGPAFINNAHSTCFITHSISTLNRTAAGFLQDGYGRAAFFSESDATAF
jgi:hypothetical protein